MCAVASALRNNSCCRFDFRLSAPLHFRFDAIARLRIVTGKGLNNSIGFYLMLVVLLCSLRGLDS